MQSFKGRAVSACVTLCIVLSSLALAAEVAIVLPLAFPDPIIETEGRYARITMRDLPVTKKAGEPAIPYKPVRVLIPRGRDVLDIELQKGEKIILEGRYTIEPAQEPVPLNYEGPPVITGPDRAIYSSAAPFPQEMKSDVAIQMKGPFRILLLNVNPVFYIPSKGAVYYYKNLTLKVRLKPARRSLTSRQIRRPKPADEKNLRGKIENPGAFTSYDDGETIPDAEGSEKTFGEGGPLGDYPHVIITSQALESASGAYTFQNLRDHRIARGMNSTIMTTEYIYGNFDGTRPDGGTDNQTRIRNFIVWAHENWGTEYVLLGGYSGLIPIRFLIADGTNIPADMYYGNLDGTFDNDADGTYGESNDGEGGGEVDLYAEVYVGRACVENDTDVSNFVRKTIAYESSCEDYLHQACLVGEHLGFGGDSEYAKPSMEEIRIGSSAHGYTTKGFAEDEFFQTSTLYDADGTWSKSQLISIINSGAHILNHLGHANYTYDMKLYTSDLSSLTNTDYFFGYSQGCNPGGFDTSNCFAEVVTTMEHGAFAVVLNARYGWGTYNSTAGPSQYYDREFWDALFGEGIKAIGRMNADSKEDNDFRISGSCMRWCFYELNLFGDPATQIQNISSKGMVSFNADAYPIPGSATVTVMDLDLDADSNAPDAVTVAISSNTEMAPESLLLTETGASTKTFRGSIPIAAGTPAAGDGTLQASDGDTVTVVYHDDNDGTGNPADVQDTAMADTSGPVISNVQSTPSVTSCTITWNTDEPGDSLVRYGGSIPPPSEVSDGSLTTSHSLRISNLASLTSYYFEVSSTDSVGNATTDSNGGAYYQFTTLERGAILFVDDDEGDSYESYFTNALGAHSYSYDTWDVSLEGSSPAFDDMDNYQIVIWNCGYNYSSSTSGLTTSEQDALSDYMDSGGSVFLCGQDIIYNYVSSDFISNYLHLANYVSDDETDQAVGIAGDWISDGISLSLSYPFTNWSDSLSPDVSSSGVFRTDGTTSYPYCATRYPADGVPGTFKIVFFAFPFEAISQSAADPNNARTVMDRVIQFLAPVEVHEISPGYGLNDRPTDVVISGSGFKAGTNVSLGGVELTLASINASSIEATVPEGLTAETCDCVVRNPDTLRSSLAAAYTALAPDGDNDQDGLSNVSEVVTHGTNPLSADTDTDGLSDSEEINVHQTDPLDDDTDDDGLNDGDEILNGCSPTNPDTDGDGISDYIEVACGSNPGDGIPPGRISINFQTTSSSRPEYFASDCGSLPDSKGYGWQ